MTSMAKDRELTFGLDVKPGNRVCERRSRSQRQNWLATSRQTGLPMRQRKPPHHIQHGAIALDRLVLQEAVEAA
jgi:hypothetical protein